MLPGSETWQSFLKRAEAHCQVLLPGASILLYEIFGN